MKQVMIWHTSLLVDFAIGAAQTTYVVVDSQLWKKYQTQPGRQEWITVVECIYTDRIAIRPFVIFKGENLMSSWIPAGLLEKWDWACNSKGWTSNIHGEQWIQKTFDVSI